MSDLATWLLEQIAEDERIARFAFNPARALESPELARWHASPRGNVNSGRHTLWADGYGYDTSSWQGPHVANWDPTRVLAECEAKRRIVEALTATMAVVVAPTTPGPESRGYRDVAAGLGDAVRFLTVPYADRPGYLEEWRP